mmetsp:Transcript_13656/g.34791  ORF Transcript_13656/g.34791 Transcript_13656/m.34791 type:complete len:427 (+) Transcript_13656:127-1407(+)
MGLQANRSRARGRAAGGGHLPDPAEHEHGGADVVLRALGNRVGDKPARDEVGRADGGARGPRDVRFVHLLEQPVRADHQEQVPPRLQLHAQQLGFCRQPECLQRAVAQRARELDAPRHAHLAVFAARHTPAARLDRRPLRPLLRHVRRGDAHRLPVAHEHGEAVARARHVQLRPPCAAPVGEEAGDGGTTRVVAARTRKPVRVRRGECEFERVQAELVRGQRTCHGGRVGVAVGAVGLQPAHDGGRDGECAVLGAGLSPVPVEEQHQAGALGGVSVAAQDCPVLHAVCAPSAGRRLGGSFHAQRESAHLLPGQRGGERERGRSSGGLCADRACVQCGQRWRGRRALDHLQSVCLAAYCRHAHLRPHSVALRQGPHHRRATGRGARRQAGFRSRRVERSGSSRHAGPQQGRGAPQSHVEHSEAGRRA